MYKPIYKKSAQKSLKSMPQKLALKFIEAFEAIAVNPANKELDIKLLREEEGLFRLRIASSSYTL
jgi:mRNA-degrading endonuclease RelE of RelBE toxin-antitoxin system